MEEKGQLIDKVINLQEKVNQIVLEYRPDKWMKLDLTIDQLKSLILIHTKGKISFKDLAQFLGITRSNITGIADRLEQNGLVIRKQGSADRRIQYLMLTEKGREILNNIRQEIVKEEIRILEALNLEDLAALEKGLSAFVRAAEEHRLFRQKGEAKDTVQLTEGY